MTKREKREQIVDKIVNAAREYKKYLLGRTFMFVFDKKYIEVSFRKEEFAHLTGVDRKMSAKEFYKEAVRGTLRQNQIYFSSRYPFDLCEKKMKELDKLPQALHQDGFILEEISAHSVCYKFGFSELNFTLCFGQDLDGTGNKRSEYYLAKSFRIGDCFERSSNVYDIEYIFSKRNNQRLYNEILLDNKGLGELPLEARKLLDETLIFEKFLKTLDVNGQ
ncbi:MAG: PBECR4 domain-containing protein [Eubacteriales bacterium]|nr:PBECR4 domain-containing protein [Eubacteriales bacterium]